MSKPKTDITKPHYRIVHYYKRDYEPAFVSLQGALANLEQRRVESKTSTYSELWQMANENDGEMIGFFEDGAPATLSLEKPTTAKLIKPKQ